MGVTQLTTLGTNAVLGTVAGTIVGTVVGNIFNGTLWGYFTPAQGTNIQAQMQTTRAINLVAQDQPKTNVQQQPANSEQLASDVSGIKKSLFLLAGLGTVATAVLTGYSSQLASMGLSIGGTAVNSYRNSEFVRGLTNQTIGQFLTPHLTPTLTRWIDKRADVILARLRVKVLFYHIIPDRQGCQVGRQPSCKEIPQGEDH